MDFLLKIPYFTPPIPYTQSSRQVTTHHKGFEEIAGWIFLGNILAEFNPSFKLSSLWVSQPRYIEPRDVPLLTQARYFVLMQEGAAILR